MLSRNDMKYLVDLNYTLVENSPKWGAPKIYPFIRQIEQEAYRQWLVDFLRDKYAILITARPQKYREATLERIKLLTGLATARSLFRGNFRHSSRNQGRLVVALYISETRQKWREIFRDRKQSKDKSHVFAL